MQLLFIKFQLSPLKNITVRYFRSESHTDSQSHARERVEIILDNRSYRLLDIIIIKDFYRPEIMGAQQIRGKWRKCYLTYSGRRSFRLQIRAWYAHSGNGSPWLSSWHIICVFRANAWVKCTLEPREDVCSFDIATHSHLSTFYHRILNIVCEMHYRLH